MKYKLIFDKSLVIPFKGRRLDCFTLLSATIKHPITFICTFFAEWENYDDIPLTFVSLFESSYEAYYEDDGQITRSFVLHEVFHQLDMSALQQAYVPEDKYVFDIDLTSFLYKLTF